MTDSVDRLLHDKIRPPGKAPIPGTMLAETIGKILQETPPEATHRTTVRDMAKVMGISVSTAQKIWRAHGPAAHRTGQFKLSNDVALVDKLGEVVGLDLDPPTRAVVLSTDEKSRIRALDRIQPGLPMTKSRSGTMPTTTSVMAPRPCSPLSTCSTAR